MPASYIRKTDPASKSGLSVHDEIREALSEIVVAAQEEYNLWEQKDGIDEEYGAGGICDALASRFGGILAARGFDIVDGGQDGDDHAFVFAQKRGEVFSVDINPGNYETGGGYSWEKIPGVEFDEGMVSIDEVFYRDVYGEDYAAETPGNEVDKRYLALARDPESNADELDEMVTEAAAANGFTVPAWHGRRGEWNFTAFDTKTHGGIHFGTLAQAEARGLKGNARRFFLKMKSTVRCRDRGGFKRIPSGSDSVVYLNRWEGVSLETVKKFSAKELDAMSDEQFRASVPEAADSCIVKLPNQAKSAALVECDENGQIIPLSKRFDRLPDFRGGVCILNLSGRTGIGRHQHGAKRKIL